MPSVLEYHMGVRHPISATVALFAALGLCFIFTAASHAQINGAPASVTSPGFGGRPINGPRASVTSLGPQGYAPGNAARFSGNGGHDHNVDGHRHHHHFIDYVPPVAYVPIPYAIDIGATEDNDQAASDDDDADYQGGPTIFDRRGSGADSYIPPVKDARPAHATAEAPSEAQDQDPDPPQEPTTLVFKDGHKLDVGNYAIVGPTLFDLTPGHARKVPLADLDLAATQKLNEDRGVIFRLPIGSQGS